MPERERRPGRERVTDRESRAGLALRFRRAFRRRNARMLSLRRVNNHGVRCRRAVYVMAREVDAMSGLSEKLEDARRSVRDNVRGALEDTFREWCAAADIRIVVDGEESAELPWEKFTF